MAKLRRTQHKNHTKKKKKKTTDRVVETIQSESYFADLLGQDVSKWSIVDIYELFHQYDHFFEVNNSHYVCRFGNGNVKFSDKVVGNKREVFRALKRQKFRCAVTDQLFTGGPTHNCGVGIDFLGDKYSLDNIRLVSFPFALARYDQKSIRYNQEFNINDNDKASSSEAIIYSVTKFIRHAIMKHKELNKLPVTIDVKKRSTFIYPDGLKLVADFECRTNDMVIHRDYLLNVNSYKFMHVMIDPSEMMIKLSNNLLNDKHISLLDPTIDIGTIVADSIVSKYYAAISSSNLK